MLWSTTYPILLVFVIYSNIFEDARSLVTNKSERSAETIGLVKRMLREKEKTEKDRGRAENDRKCKGKEKKR